MMTKNLWTLFDEMGEMPEYQPLKFSDFLLYPAMFDRSLQKQATQAGTTAANNSAGYGTQAATTAGTLTPILTQQAKNPPGLTPEEKNAELVAGAQGAGGATGAVAGEAGLAANRSRNTGSLSAVLDAASRARTQQLSRTAEGVENQNTALKTQQQQSALSQLRNLYGTQVAAQEGNAGQVASDVNAGVNAGNSGWLQNTEGVINTATGAAKNVAQSLYGGGSGFANS